MIFLCVGMAVMHYKRDGQPRQEQVYNFKKALYAAIMMTVLVSLIYWL